MKSITLLIIDESGSMAGMEGFVNETYLGIVNQIKTELAETPELEQFIEIWTFEGANIRQRIPLMQLSLDTVPYNLEFKPGYSTPLFDAMGISLTGMQERIKSIEILRDVHVNVSIITDGMENSSRKYSSAEVSKLIEALKECNWNFAYYGTDHDVLSVATSLKMDYSSTFEKSEQGFKENLRTINRVSSETRSSYLRKLKQMKS